MMTSSWRHFEFVILGAYLTYPPSFMTIGPCVICVLNNRYFDDVIMTSHKFPNSQHISTIYQSYYNKNFESTIYRSLEMLKLMETIQIFENF